jgi:hypothetical protein
MGLLSALVPVLGNGTNCSAVPAICLNGGTCVVLGNLTQCQCLTGFSGTGCADGEALHVLFTVFELICLVYIYVGLAVLLDECVQALLSVPLKRTSFPFLCVEMRVRALRSRNLQSPDRFRIAMPTAAAVLL